MIASIFWGLVRFGAALLIAVLVLGWAQEFHPAFDSFSHFRLVFCVLLAFATLLLLIGKKWYFSGISLTTLAISLFLTHPYLPDGVEGLNAAHSIEGKDIRVVQMNLRFNNPTPEKAAAVISTANPDIIFLQEITYKTRGVLAAFKKSHPYQVSCNSRAWGSVGILSRFPFVQKPPRECFRSLGFASASIDINGTPVTLANFHSPWPWPRRQTSHINKLKKHFQELKSPLIFTGDFNAAPWSAVVQRVARMTGTTVADGVVHSWAPKFPGALSWIGPLLPLDQTLLSPQFILKNRIRLADGGSDHFPILSQIILP